MGGARENIPGVVVIVISAAVIVAVLAVAASDDDARPAPGRTTTAAVQFPPAITPYEPSIDPADFVVSTTIDNDLLPLSPGYSLIYEGTSDGEAERDVVKVTRKTKTIMGIECVVVKDVVSSGGEITEKTFDWYAQDNDGNVWYFGEDSTEYEDGQPASTKGSWEAGVDGALPGIIMLADPQPGDEYRQEYAPGEAEDVARVVRTGPTISVPFGSFENVLVTEDSSLIETSLVERKYYSAGIGVVLERSIKGPPEVVKLVEGKPRD